MGNYQYQETHPWLSFHFDVRELTPKILLNLGEILSKCEHVAGAPLKPEQARELHTVFLTKGLHATTSIEGNTLNEDEVKNRIDGELQLPESLEYQGVEIDNLLSLFNDINSQCVGGKIKPLTTERIKEFNSLLLQEQPLGEAGTAGQVRTHSRGVGNGYRGAPASDC